MTTLSVSLSDEMMAFVEAQVSQNGFASAGDYLLSLVRAKARAELEAKLREGLQGPSTVLDAEAWESIRREARKQLSAETSGT